MGNPRLDNFWNAPRGSALKQSKLTESDIPLIRELRSAGLKYRDIASKFDVDHSTIWLACNGGTWSHVR